MGTWGLLLTKKLKGFDVEVLVYDKYKTGFGNTWVKEVTEQELFDKADVLSLHIPLTAETKFMIDEHYFDKFKKTL